MQAKLLISEEELVALPNNGNRHELLDGELLSMPPAKPLHSRISLRIFNSLQDWTRAGGQGEARQDGWGYRLSPGTIVQPDVSWVAPGWPEPGDDYVAGAPDLALEVLSPQDRAEVVERKFQAYLTHGAREVWIVAPSPGKLYIHLPEGSPILFAGQAAITSALLPGWSAKVTDLLS